MKIREVLRLKFAAGLSNRQIAASCGALHSTVGQYLRRAEEAGIGWQLPEEMSQRELEQRLFAQPKRIGARATFALNSGEWVLFLRLIASLLSLLLITEEALIVVQSLSNQAGPALSPCC